MPSYLVEAFLSGVDPDGCRARERAVRSAVDALTREGTAVRFAGSIHVPEDEICLFNFEAPSAADVERVAQDAGLRLLRVVEVFPSIRGGPSR